MHCATLTRNFAVHSSEHWIKSKFTRISLHTVRVVLFLHRGTFLHAFYFISITTHEHTITLCCGAQKNRLIEANYLSNEDTFKMIHCCSTLLQQHIYDIYIYSDPEYWVRAINNYMCSLIICSWSDIFDNIVMTGKKGYCTEQSFTILICSAKILTRRLMSKLVI